MRGQGRIYRRKYRDKLSGEMRAAATYTLEYYVHGRMRRETASTYTEAVRLLKRRQGEIVQG